VEVVFVLDTTGSMSNLIEGAKVKIWKIVNQIVSGKPVPEVRVGLVAYRDRGDEYITRFTPLTNDLDAVYGKLRGFRADGGGDGPESVNQALAEGLSKPDWSRDDRTLRIIYLVGDAPPHMDYENDVKYLETCQAAARAGVILNTIQCGDWSETTKVWQEIARKAEGRFVQIDQSGGMTAIETPFDERLAELSGKLSGTTLFYGDARLRETARAKLAEAGVAADAAPAEAKAERAGYLAKSGRIAGADLLGMLEREEITLDKIEKKHLPEDLQELTDEELQAEIAKRLAERKEIQAELLELDRKRAEYIKDALAKRGDEKDAFDEKVLEALRAQAAKIGVTWR
jgi:hypothetical protein